MAADHRPLILLTGASGYIGGRLLKELEKAGWPVRCLARRPDFLRSKVAASTEVIKADCLDRSSLVPAMAGVQTAYYLVHSMGSSGKFEQEDREAAQNFADVARDSGLRRIVFLGGLGNQDQALSAHLRSRHEVADILRSSEIPTIEFRASIVIGSGSLSFEMIRALVQRLPVMICPRWVAVKAHRLQSKMWLRTSWPRWRCRWSSAEFSKSGVPTKSATARLCRSMPGNAASADG
jgi:uncharacterized protein YbjT (DUF2867 family)